MNEGAFALLDCLGFKGIWKNFPAEKIVSKLEAIQAAAARIDADGPKNWIAPGALQTTFSFLSDTVVIGVYPTRETNLSDTLKGWLVIVAAQLSAVIAKEFLRDDSPRTLRGCITYGQFLIKGNFIVGPAVDEAASAERLAEGAFIWLSPVASALYDIAAEAAQVELRNDIDAITVLTKTIRLCSGEREAESYLKSISHLTPERRNELSAEIKRIWTGQKYLYLVVPNYPVLMKGLGPLQCHVVNPWTVYMPHEGPTVLAKYRDAMQGTDLSIVLKHQQTEKFLRTAMDLLRPQLEEWIALSRRVRSWDVIPG
jgi:hypothetical protein